MGTHPIFHFGCYLNGSQAQMLSFLVVSFVNEFGNLVTLLSLLVMEGYLSLHSSVCLNSRMKQLFLTIVLLLQW